MKFIHSRNLLETRKEICS